MPTGFGKYINQTGKKWLLLLVILATLQSREDVYVCALTGFLIKNL